MKLIFYIIPVLLSTNCTHSSQKNYINKTDTSESDKADYLKNEKFLTQHSDTCGCSAQIELKDSLNLVHIKDLFYKSKTGHLYERTIGQREKDGHLTDVEYFNGKFSQQVDPMTFMPLDGWYAKDKNYVYFYKPTSGGMQISKIDNADSKTFEVLKGHYRYGIDKNHFYDEMEIIEGFFPSNTSLKLDKNNRVIEMTCEKKKFKFEITD